MFNALAGKAKCQITSNKPHCSTALGYGMGIYAPGRASDRTRNAEGDSGREPRIVGDNLLVAHGAAVKVFKEEFKPKFGGQIGIALNGRSGVDCLLAPANGV
jgi:beta-glucosidase